VPGEILSEGGSQPGELREVRDSLADSGASLVEAARGYQTADGQLADEISHLLDEIDRQNIEDQLRNQGIIP
jgi:hypothetical protein